MCRHSKSFLIWDYLSKQFFQVFCLSVSYIAQQKMFSHSFLNASHSVYSLENILTDNIRFIIFCFDHHTNCNEFSESHILFI